MARSLRFSHNQYSFTLALAFSALLLPSCSQQKLSDGSQGFQPGQNTQNTQSTKVDQRQLPTNKRLSLGRQGKNPSLPTNTRISPYLAAHQDDLVSWAPWGQDAFELARAENKPVLLSIGFSSCHWCHVMQKESFNDPATAKYMNDHFINVLVDREERPDVDADYTRQLEALSVRVGWPMTLFLRPDGKVFYAGTYFPPGDETAPHSFRKVLAQINAMWLSDRRAVDAACAKVESSLAARDKSAALLQSLTYANLNFALGRLLQRCDLEYGGLKQSRKFPVAAINTLMMRLSVAEKMRRSYGDLLPYCRAYITTTLDGMANGQINDQVGAGFFRYATNKQWLRPHFEKMLCDNALISQNYFEAYSLTNNSYWLTKGVRTVEFMLDELRLPSGMFAGSLNADSLEAGSVGAEKKESEGAFYTYTAKDSEQALPKSIRAEVEAGCNFTAAGNCGEGKNLPYFKSKVGTTSAAGTRATTTTTTTTTSSSSSSSPPSMASIDEGLQKLQHWRLRRPRPARNNTVVAAWNGMAISSLVSAYKATRNPKYLEVAQKAANALLLKLSSPDQLAHSDISAQQGFLDDYAYVEKAMLDLYSVDRGALWRRKARDLNAIVLERFLDKDNGKFRYAPVAANSFGAPDRNLEILPERVPERGRISGAVYATTDGTWPGAAGTAIENLIRLDAVPTMPGDVSSDADYLAIARRSLAASGRAMQEDPVAHASMLVALERLLRMN
ncbi:thioredoxin domain-containing protein [bacterium]|nr:thioredoxin domain-containing protein [bacterium]